MARPCQPFDQSLQSVIFAAAQRSLQGKPERRGRLPTRYRLWREVCVEHRCAWSTFRYHFDKLVAAQKFIVDEDGLYWLPGHEPQPPRRPVRRALPAPTLQPALF